MLRESLLIHRRLGDTLDTAADLCRSALLLASEGQATAAAKILASVEAIDHEIGGAYGYPSRLNRDTVRAIRSRLDDATWHEVQQAGGTLTPAAAVEVALDSLDSLGSVA